VRFFNFLTRITLTIRVRIEKRICAIDSVPQKTCHWGFQLDRTTGTMFVLPGYVHADVSDQLYILCQRHRKTINHTCVWGVWGGVNPQPGRKFVNSTSSAEGIRKNLHKLRYFWVMVCKLMHIVWPIMLIFLGCLC